MFLTFGEPDNTVVLLWIFDSSFGDSCIQGPWIQHVEPNIVVDRTHEKSVTVRNISMNPVGY